MYQKPKSKVQTPRIPSATSFDDQSLEVETREDEEQNVKLQEIVDLLLAAGYFRARIKGLSPFDKIVGGMTWCIEMCNMDIDIDLLFQENLTIGQKIGLTEKIVAVLPRMKCPYQIEPHQIQGLDNIHVFPVVQWLVKRAIETREETGDYVRAYSILQFNKSHKTPEDETMKVTEDKVWGNIHELREIYQPKRRYRHPAPHKLKEEEIRVQSTLLEYGKHHGILQSSKDNDDSEEANKSGNENSLSAVEKQQIEALMSSMNATEEYETRLSASTVGNIVGMQSAQIQQIAAAFADKQAELASVSGTGGTQHHKRLVASLTKQLEAKKEQLMTTQEKYDGLQKHYNELNEKSQKMQERQKTLNEEMKEMDALETDENKSVLYKLRALVAMNENLKRQEQEFRAHCKEELARLQNNIEDLSSTKQGTLEDQERKQLIMKQYVADKERLQKMRIVLARKNREIASLMRKIDEVPSRTELSQYQRRFVELYNQVAAKHKETKQFYTLYNTLEDTRMYLCREVNLLNSILDNFSQAMASSNTKEQFLSQFSQIVDGIKQAKFKVDKKKQEEKMRRDQLHDQYLDLIEKQRLYFKTVKDFTEECRKNEVLVSKNK